MISRLPWCPLISASSLIARLPRYHYSSPSTCQLWMPLYHSSLSPIAAPCGCGERGRDEDNFPPSGQDNVQSNHNQSIDRHRFALKSNYTGSTSTTVAILHVATRENAGHENDADAMNRSKFNIGDIMKSLLNANYSALQPDNLWGGGGEQLFHPMLRGGW